MREKGERGRVRKSERVRETDRQADRYREVGVSAKSGSRES